MKARTLLLGAAIALLIPLTACGEPAAEPAPGGEQRLIGYQVKRLDQLIELTFDRLVTDAGLTRRQWQTLNTLATGPAGDAELTDALRPFWEVDDENLGEMVTDLTARGWITRGADGRYALTETGRTVHATAADSVGRIRELSADGVSEQEFGQMMDVMARIIGNLERAAA
ncbi:MAG: MarR family transcriptional regulator [Nocardia sp.]|nr:MarR family transcriptional regulator [Nocardia sp.]NUS93922.1 MarR family transcriptional regulator [Nocardia sp.]